jgi:hypothetical protein
MGDKNIFFTYLKRTIISFIIIAGNPLFPEPETEKPALILNYIRIKAGFGESDCGGGRNKRLFLYHNCDVPVSTASERKWMLKRIGCTSLLRCLE